MVSIGLEGVCPKVPRRVNRDAVRDAERDCEDDGGFTNLEEGMAGFATCLSIPDMLDCLEDELDMLSRRP